MLGRVSLTLRQVPATLGAGDGDVVNFWDGCLGEWRQRWERCWVVAPTFGAVLERVHQL